MSYGAGDEVVRAFIERLVRQVLWYPKMLGDPAHADAILDRLIHNAYRIELRGATMRQRQSSTAEKSKANSEISKGIPDTHTIHTRVTSATKKDKQTQ